jgi:modulator of FtsH protease HflK
MDDPTGGNGRGDGPGGRRVQPRILRTGNENLNNLSKTLTNLQFKPGLMLIPFLIVALAYGALTTFYTVPQDSVALVQRFGAYTRTAEPGLHLRIPFGVERVHRVPVERVIKEEFGFRTEAAGVTSVYSDGDYSRESLMLTGDLNIADVQWVVQYKIKDPYLYVFHVRGVGDTFRDLSQAVATRIVGDRSVSEVLTEGRSEIAIVVQQELQEMLDHYETGVQVVTVQLQDVNPPGPVKSSFNEVNEAKQEQERLTNEAWEAYNRAIPEAQGSAKRAIAEANGYATDRVNRALGDAQRFSAVYTEYRLAPEVTRRRIYLETMNTIYPRLNGKVIVDEDIESLLPMLDIGAAAASRKKGGAK